MKKFVNLVIKLLGVIWFVFCLYAVIDLVFDGISGDNFVGAMLVCSMGFGIGFIGLLPTILPYIKKKKQAKSKNNNQPQEIKTVEDIEHAETVAYKKEVLVEPISDNMSVTNIVPQNETLNGFIKDGEVYIKTDGSDISDEEAKELMVVTFLENLEKELGSESETPTVIERFESPKLYERDFEILENTRQILLTTTNIETFFSRLNFGNEKSLDLQVKLYDAEGSDRDINILLESLHKRLGDLGDYSTCVDGDIVADFIDRYYKKHLDDVDKLKTEKAKENRKQKFFVELHGYDNQIRNFNTRLKIAELDKRNGIKIPYSTWCTFDDEENAFVDRFFETLSEEQLMDMYLLRGNNGELQFVYKKSPIGVVRLQKRSRWLSTSAEVIEESKVTPTVENCDMVINTWHTNMGLV